MVKMIGRITGVDMWVADDRVKEYQEAGYKLASDPEKKPEKKPTKKGTRKAR